jgi:hypothetical protein
MSEQIDDGGPAFPDDSQHNYTGGMTLRDYFAAAALQGQLSILELSKSIASGQVTAMETADACYQWADAMLAARKEGA